jgi:hypothetical protein
VVLQLKQWARVPARARAGVLVSYPRSTPATAGSRAPDVLLVT